MSTEEFNLWNLVINCIIAFGTLAAVITALYLGLKQNKPVIKIFCGIRQIYGLQTVSPDQQFVYFSATNAGIMDEYVSTFGYRIGLPFLFKFCSVNPSYNDFEPTFPTTVSPGGQCSDFIEIEKFDEYQLSFFIQYIQEVKIPEWIKRKSWFPVMILKMARCWVYPNRANKRCFGKLEPNLMDHILNAYNSQTNKSDSP